MSSPLSWCRYHYFDDEECYTPSPFKPTVFASRREALRKRQTLQGLATECIIGKLSSTHWWAQAKKVGNPIENLSNPILLSLLAEFCGGRCGSQEDLSPRDWELLELLLQAANVTEIDLRHWRRLENFKTVEEKLIAFCPELRILTLKSVAEHDSGLDLLDKSICYGDYAPQPMNPDFCRLKNLCVLRALALFDPESLRVAATSLPNLEVFEFSVQEHHFKDVVIMTALPKLREIYINSLFSNVNKRLESHLVVDTLLQLVEKLPRLTTLGSSELINRAETSPNLIAQFGNVCPSRELLIDSMCLKDSSVDIFNATWVANLGVRRLRLDGIKEKTAEQLCRLVPTDQLRALEICSNRPKIIYMFLGSLAPNVTHLRLGDCFTDEQIEERDSELDVHKVLLAVPKIKEFDFLHNSLNQVNKPKKRVHKGFFKNMRRFDGTFSERDENKKEASRLLKKFILGSEVCEELKLSSFHYIDFAFIEKVLRKHPHFKLRVRKLIFDVDDSMDMEPALKAAALLVGRSPMLDEIEFFQSKDFDGEDEDQTLREFFYSGVHTRFINELASLAIKLTVRHVSDGHPSFDSVVEEDLWWSDYGTNFY